MQKTRLDVYLTENGLAETRAKAQALIMAGVVFVDGQKCDKSGSFVREGAAVEVRENALRYVSRGGLKLEKALAEFGVDLNGKITMDIGASTGGFTDCMLQNGAEKVYAVDVGYGQLAWKLRNDERVVNMERVNIRGLEGDSIPPLDFISIDVSFISLGLVLPVAMGLLKDGGEIIALIKPQFEAGREQVGKKGIVRERKIHIQVLERILGLVQGACGLTFSPIAGGGSATSATGNIEFLAHIIKGAESAKIDVERVVEDAHICIGD